MEGTNGLTPGYYRLPQSALLRPSIFKRGSEFPRVSDRCSLLRQTQFRPLHDNRTNVTMIADLITPPPPPFPARGEPEVLLLVG